MARKILLRRNSTSGVLPESNDMQYGELALNYNGGNEMLAIKNSDDDIATFSSDTVWQAYHDNVERVVGEALNDLHSTKLDKDEAAETYVSDEYYTHTDNNYTTAEKNKLASIAEGAEANVQSDWNVTDTASDAYIANKPTNVSDFANDAGYTTNVGTITGITMNNTSKGTSGVVDLGTVITSVDDVFGKVYYDSSSKHINFYGKDDTSMTTVLGYVDATNFIKDGMVDSVTIGNATVDGQTVECLIITFNTDAGKSPINIPLSDIFDSGLYYTKSETDTLLAAKQDTLTFDSTPTSGSTNPVTSGGVYDKFADYSLIISSALNNLNDRVGSVQSDVDAKQDTLEFDDYPIENSPNPVTSGGIYERLDYDSFVVASALNDLNDRKQDVLTFDSAPTANSDNPVTSGGVKTALDDKLEYYDLDKDANLAPIFDAWFNDGVISDQGDFNDACEYLLALMIEHGDSYGNSKDVVYRLQEHIVNRAFFEGSPWEENDHETACDISLEAFLANPGAGVVFGLDRNNSTGNWSFASFNAATVYQEALTFDSTPTTNSDNPVTSGGIKTALEGKQDNMLIVTATVTGGDGITYYNATLNKTHSEILAAMVAGRNVYVSVPTMFGGCYVALTQITGNNNHSFICVINGELWVLHSSRTDSTNNCVLEKLDVATSSDLAEKQDELVSGTNIKTVNGTTILGSGNIDADDVVMGKIDGVSFYEVASYNQVGTPTFSQTAAAGSINKIYLDILTNKLYWYDPKVVAVGESHYEQVGGSDITIDDELDDESTNPVENQAVSNYINEIERVTAESLNDLNDRKQDVLVSGTNIKTVNNNSLLGSGNITIDGGDLLYDGPDGDSVSSGDNLSQAIEYLDADKVRFKSYANKTAMDADGERVNGTIGYDESNEEFYIWNTDSGEWLKLGGEPLVETTYSNLRTLKTNGKLVPGVRYRITDFVTTTKTTDTQSAGHPFDVIVLALSQNKLAEEARAIQHEGDTYFSSSRLEAWKIWYSMEETSSSSVCDWSVLPSNGGKGTIYRMIDEWGNDCPYDFKNIQFKRKMTGSEYDPTSGTDTWVYTFCSRTFTDASKKTTPDVYKNVMGVYFSTANKRALNDIVYLGVAYCMANQIGVYCYECTFGDETYDMVIGNTCNNITFGKYENGVSVGVGCSNIEVCPYTENITIEKGVKNTTISTSATDASSGRRLRNITVKNGVSGATISHPTLKDNFHTTYQPANSQVVSV